MKRFKINILGIIVIFSVILKFSANASEQVNDKTIFFNTKEDYLLHVFSNDHDLQRIRGNNLNEDYQFILKLPDEHAERLLINLKKTPSQLKQDLFVLSTLDFKRDGFFIEFGATNGFNLSNSYLLEKEFGWNGILAEPAKCWHEALQNNRNAFIETDCVWSESGQTLTFNETQDAELSTISEFSSCDWAKDVRKNCISYDVSTISLSDLLEKYNAPTDIDYLSIDTEGSEFDILNSFNFDKYSFKVITCEHNNTSARQKIYDLLTSHGYIRRFEEFSKWDDWYIKV